MCHRISFILGLHGASTGSVHDITLLSFNSRCFFFSVFFYMHVKFPMHTITEWPLLPSFSSFCAHSMLTLHM